MPTLGMPDRPHLDSFRRQARALQRAVRAGDPDAVTRLARHHPGVLPDHASGFQLSAAQLVVAREYGFASWPRLARYMETVAEHGWDTRLGAAPAAGPAEEFCRLACLTYSREDGPERWAQARQLLAERPDLTTLNIWAAAAAARPDDVGRLLAEQPRRVAERGGPFRWRPLFYLVYSRFDQAVPAERVLAVARQLLDAGADPDDGYLFDAPGPARERTPFGRRVVWCRGGGPARLWARVTPLDRSCLVHDPRGVSGPLPWPVDPGLSIVVRARPRGAHLAIRRAADLRREDRDRAGCRDRERLNRREGQRASS